MVSAAQYVAEMAKKASPIQKFYEQAETYHSRKLWHQLTLTLVELLKEDYWLESSHNEELQTLYSSFIKSFQTKINKLRLAQFAVAVAQTISDLSESFAFLSTILEQTKNDNEANAYLLAAQASIKLQLDDQKECKTLLAQSNTHLSNVTGGDPAVPSAYYRVLYDYHKVRNEAVEFYDAALTYLSHESLDNLSNEDKLALSTDMALAALSGEKIFNFGALMNHAIFESIRKEWLGELLQTVNSGDMAGYDKVVKQFAKDISTQPILVNSDQTIREKLSILALLSLALGRSSNDRTLSFADIASACRLEIDEVELLLMKALALELIRGSIDQIDQRVSITWVQPRVLDMQQLNAVADRLAEWSSQVAAQVANIEQQMPDGVLA